VRLVYAILILSALHVCQAADELAPLAEIPFSIRDSLLWIEVTVPTSAKPLNFLIDSGAQVSVINSSTAQRLGIKGGRAVNVKGVGATTKGFWPQKLEARAGRVELPRNYLMLDLGSLGEACTNATVDGIIGADFFQDRIVQIDYQKRVVRILLERPSEGEMQVLPLKIRPCGMLVSVRINDARPQWVRLDTGCASALQWVTGSIRPEQCTRRVAVALTPFSIPTTKTTLTVGAVRFEGVPTDLQKKEVFPGEKGLLGNGLLSRFQTVTIDAKRKEVVFGPVLHTN
jgi:aspartyl protease